MPRPLFLQGRLNTHRRRPTSLFPVLVGTAGRRTRRVTVNLVEMPLRERPALGKKMGRLGARVVVTLGL